MSYFMKVAVDKAIASAKAGKPEAFSANDSLSVFVDDFGIGLYENNHNLCYATVDSGGAILIVNERGYPVCTLSADGKALFSAGVSKPVDTVIANGLPREATIANFAVACHQAV